MFLNENEFTSLDIGILLEKRKKKEPAIVSLEEFSKCLNPEYSALFNGLDIKSEISILFYDYLPNLEFIWAIHKSQDFVGCTGDDSFSKVISMGKVPLYYANGHKIALKNSFIGFLTNAGFKEITKIFQTFIDDDSTDALTSEFMRVLSKIDHELLAIEMERFKTEIFYTIRNKYSIFNEIIALLINQNWVLPFKDFEALSLEGNKES